MPELRVEKLAQILVAYSASVQPGDKVRLSGEIVALPLLRETYKRAVLAGAHVVLNLEDEYCADFLIRHGSDEQLAWLAPGSRWMAEESDVSITIRATQNTRHGTSADPQRGVMFAKSHAVLARTRAERTAANQHRWTLTQFPTGAYAQEADMSLEEFEDFVYHATFADQPDPVVCWNAIRDSQQKYVDWLKGRREVTVRGPNVDLKLRIDDRPFINSDGKRNMPSGEIFTGPVEDSANGWVRFTYPAIRGGRQVEGVELHFENGRVVNATARKNQDYLLAQIDSDPGARYLGEFAIGTNYGITRFTGNILFDEKIGGTFHMALGNGYIETGSHNRSSVHWDMICDMRQDSEIVVDGDLLYKNGQFAF
ncbi:MAG: aminopeptidase [Aggregatilineales bacterium]